MLAPRPRRPASRASIATTLIDSSPPSSWSGAGMPRSRGTSMTEWSDQGTEMPPPIDTSLSDYEDAYGLRGKGGWRDMQRQDDQDQAPLIDFEEEIPATQKMGAMEETKPADRLKMLLRQMEMEVIDSTPAVPRVLRPSEQKAEETKPGWRSGRRLGLNHNAERLRDEASSSPEIASREHDDDGDDEIESPPTPPLRLHNPYLARRNDRTAPLSPSKDNRLPSRAAVLRNSTSSDQSRSTPSPPAPPSSVPARSPLETFIATHPVPPHYPSPSDPSSSRSYDRSSSSASSRKGKERASFIEDSQQTPHPHRHTRFSRVAYSPPSRSAPTPRRRSVEIAPDDSALFAQEAASLEVQGEVELDLEEISGDIPWDPDIEESRMDEPPPTDEPTVRNSTRDHSQLSRVLSRPIPSPPPKRTVEDTSLPALPEPSYDSSAEEDDKPNTLSSRQASLFRSPSRSLSRTGSTSREKSSVRVSNESYETTQYRDAKSTFAHSRELSRHTISPNQSRSVNVTPQEPLLASTAQVSTPVRSNISAVAPTPHPPGRWYSPAQRAKPARSSPLAKKDEHSLMDSEGDISVHRLRVSPARKASVPPRSSPKQMEKVVEEEEGNSSFLGRLPGLSRMVAKKLAIPQPSTTLQDVRDALAHAAQSSTTARVDVEKTQRQFLEALATAQHVGGGAVAVARKGWTWGSWAWWVGVELLLVWGVFRVTLDYATSAAHLAAIDPFSLAANAQAVTVPLPTAISAFILPHRNSANFFDLLDRLELWRRLDELGVMSGPVVAEGARILGVGGVPT